MTDIYRDIGVVGPYNEQTPSEWYSDGRLDIIEI